MRARRARRHSPHDEAAAGGLGQPVQIDLGLAQHSGHRGRRGPCRSMSPAAPAPRRRNRRLVAARARAPRARTGDRGRRRSVRGGWGEDEGPRSKDERENVTIVRPSSLILHLALIPRLGDGDADRFRHRDLDCVADHDAVEIRRVAPSRRRPRRRRGRPGYGARLLVDRLDRRGDGDHARSGAPGCWPGSARTASWAMVTPGVAPLPGRITWNDSSPR